MDPPNIAEFTSHPDYQQIATFFLGAVFITSLNYSFQWTRSVFPHVRHCISKKRAMQDDVENSMSEKVSITNSVASVLHRGENRSLAFTISLCFTFASIAYFGSLLSFPRNGGATCAFLVAWGGMAAQTARIVGIFILLLELRRLGIRNVEFYASLAFLFADMVLVFVHNAIGTGALSFYAPLDIAICYRKHFLPTALTTSLISIFLEFYVLVRLSSILIKHVTLASQRLTALNDGRIARVLALLLFDLLTIGPSAVHINVLADFIPLSIGALFVLMTFNNSMPHPDGTHTLNSGVPASSPNPVRRSMWFRSSSGASSQVQPNVSGKSPAPPAVPKSLLHPFSAQYQPEASRFSTTTGSMSIEEGIIQTAQRSAPPTATGTVIAAETASAPVTSSQDGYEILSINVIPPATSEADAQAMSPEMSPSITPTSILMHPWHEKHDEGSRQYNADGYDRRTSVTSTIKPTQHLSYTVQGFTFPKPPIPSPTGATQRYSSSTLASPLFSQEGGESSEGQRRVQLLTFASTFRSASAGVIKDSKANALNPSQPVST